MSSVQGNLSSAIAINFRECKSYTLYEQQAVAFCDIRSPDILGTGEILTHVFVRGRGGGIFYIK